MTLYEATDIGRSFNPSKYWGDEEVVCEIEEEKTSKYHLEHFKKFGWMIIE